MSASFIYTAAARWRRKPEDHFLDGRYSRAHEWAFDGGARVPASSSPHVAPLPFSDPAGVDPEEALAASLASRHMLFLLDFAVEFGRFSWYEEWHEQAGNPRPAAGERARVARPRGDPPPLVRFACARR